MSEKNLILTSKDKDINKRKINNILMNKINIRSRVPHLYKRTMEYLPESLILNCESQGIDARLLSAQLISLLVEPTDKYSILRTAFPTEVIPSLYGEHSFNFPKVYRPLTNKGRGTITPGASRNDIVGMSNHKITQLKKKIHKLSLRKEIEEEDMIYLRKQASYFPAVMNLFREDFYDSYEKYLMSAKPYEDPTAEYNYGLLNDNMYTKFNGSNLTVYNYLDLTSGGVNKSKIEIGNITGSTNNIRVSSGADFKERQENINNFFLDATHLIGQRLNMMNPMGFTAIIPTKIFRLLDNKVSNSTTEISCMQNLKEQRGIRFITSKYVEQENGEIIIFANKKDYIVNVIVKEMQLYYDYNIMSKVMKIQAEMGISGILLLKDLAILRVKGAY